MYGAVSSFLERVVPEEGAASKGLDIMGFTLPPGAIVGTQAWSMHRDPDVFPHPDVFEPERWLAVDASTEEAERLARCVPFPILTPHACHGNAGPPSFAP